MLVLLQLLQQALDQCADGTHDASHISGICLQLHVDVPRTFREYASAELAAADFLRYHRGLVALYECALATADGIVMKSVHKLLASHERLFADLIPPSEPLPDFHGRTLEAETRARLDTVVDGLRRKEIPATYLAELGHAVDTLFTEGKPPVLDYHHRAYLHELFGMLGQMAADPRKKNWPERFEESLVNYNFNYMGFFNRWRETREAAFEAARKTGSTPALVSGWYDTLQHHTPIPDLAFIPRQPSLLEHMTLYVCTKAAAIVEWKNEQSRKLEASSPAIKTTLNSKMLSLDLRYRSKRGYYDYPNMAEAAIAYSGSHLSKTGRNISPHTLQRFDTVELEDAVHIYLQDLTKMISEIRRDFKL